MKKKIITAALALTGILTTGFAAASGDIHWSYSGHEGPEHWGELTPAFSACSTGKNSRPSTLPEWSKPTCLRFRLTTTPVEMKP